MFGSEYAVRDIVQFSHYAQVILIVIFISHSLYALILYFLGNRDKRLFFFSLLTFCFTIYTFLSTGDKILDQYLLDRKSTRLNSSHVAISYAVFCLKKTSYMS